MLFGCGKGPPIEHVSYHSLFNGDVEVTKIETTQNYMMEKWITSLKLKIEIKKPGTYLFEGWLMNYRSVDTLGEKWEYKIEKLPFIEEKILQSVVYRLESTRVIEKNNIERDTVFFPYHGLISGFAIQGKPISQ